MAIATSFQGLEIEEEPVHSNKGWWIKVFQEEAGISGGDAWCMAFVYYVYTCAYDFYPHMTNPLERTGWCYGQWQHALKHPELKTLLAPDILAGAEIPIGAIWIRYDGLKRGHTGIVIAHDLDTQSIKSIEGNSSDGVRGITRKLKDMVGFRGVIY